MTLNRREALLLTSASALALSSCNRGDGGRIDPPPIEPPRDAIKWRLGTTWPSELPILSDAGTRFALLVNVMSQGKLIIEVYHDGVLAPPLEVFNRVSNREFEACHGASYYWADDIPAARFFASIPFGMNAQQMNAWLFQEDGAGLDLWREVYDEWNVIPFPMGNTGVQMGGWFKKKIVSANDFRDVKMRIPGLGGEVISRLGGEQKLTAGGDILAAFESGEIDAAEWIGPYHDFILRLYTEAPYYHYPGWQELGLNLELAINRSAYEELPDWLKEIIKVAANHVHFLTLCEFEASNYRYLDILRRQKTKEDVPIEVVSFNRETLRALAHASAELIGDITKNEPISRRIYQSFRDFKISLDDWKNISEYKYHQVIDEFGIEKFI